MLHSLHIYLKISKHNIYQFKIAVFFSTFFLLNTDLKTNQPGTQGMWKGICFGQRGSEHAAPYHVDTSPHVLGSALKGASTASVLMDSGIFQAPSAQGKVQEREL